MSYIYYKWQASVDAHFSTAQIGLTLAERGETCMELVRHGKSSYDEYVIKVWEVHFDEADKNQKV